MEKKISKACKEWRVEMIEVIFVKGNSLFCENVISKFFLQSWLFVACGMVQSTSDWQSTTCIAG